MEKRQLDFNAPLISARRYSSPSKSSEPVKCKVAEKPQPYRQQSFQPKKPEYESELTKPASVPFQWEQIPGRPKGEAESHSYTPRRVYCSGERSNDQNVYGPQAEASSFADHASLLEKLNESLNCRDVYSDSESGDDAYSDALDTLSLSESWSFNYSVSGISGCQSSGVKPSGTFCVDTQTRDFMMNRFLPAAKAAVVETPEYAVKKSSLVKETPLKQVKKAVSGEMKVPLNPLRQCSLDALPHYTRCTNVIGNVESEDEDQESIAPKKKSGKTWGILPRLNVKNSLCLLNPLPALRQKTKSRCPSPSTHEVRRMTRNAHSGPLDKNACQVVQKKRFHSGLLSRDLMSGLDNNGHGQFMHSFDSNRSALVSPLRRYRSGNISPYRNEIPQSPFREGVGFLGVPKEAETFNTKIASSRKMFKALQDVSKNQIYERASVPTIVAEPVEKTVYVDYVKKKDLPSMKPFRSAKAEEFANSLMVGRKKKSPNSGPIAKVLPSAFATDKVKPSEALYQESINKARCEAKLVAKEEQKGEFDDGREFDPPLKSPLPPPLPKSPSESWLWRTLPSISLGNPFANSRQQKQGHNISAANTKWETIVKTSNLQHDRARYSEELMNHASYRPMKS